MAIGIGVLVKGVWSFTGGLLSRVLEVITKNPGKAAACVGLAVLAYVGYNFAYTRGAESRDEQVTELKTKLDEQIKLVLERNAKLDALSAASTAIADSNKLVIDMFKSELAAVQENYAANLAVASRGPKVITKYVEVPVPGSTETTQVQFQNGLVVCDRYPAGYAETVNQAVAKTRETMRKEIP